MFFGGLSYVNMFFMMLFMVVLWIAFVVGIVWLVRFAATPRVPPGPSSIAMDSLKERYARGEIGREEFEQKKRDIA